MKRISALICSVVCVLTVMFSPVAKADNIDTANTVKTTKQTSAQGGYVEYLDINGSLPHAQQNVIIDGSSFVYGEGVSSAESEFSPSGTKPKYEGVKAKKAGSFAEYDINIYQSGMYNFSVTYCPDNKKSSDIKIGIMIDGNYPFSEAEYIDLPRFYTDDGDYRTDEYGNQYAASQKEIFDFTTVSVYDESGIFNTPLQFALTSGTHRITLYFESENIYVSNFAFTAPENIKPYDEIKDEYDKKGYISATGDVITIEAEQTYYKNASSLVSKSDNTSPTITPSDAYVELCNYIGGTSWQASNEEIVWRFNVEQSGLYKIGLMNKQDQNMNLSSYRYLKIDGKTPFDECTRIKFDYDINWTFKTIGNADDEPYLFYLEKGAHTLSLSVTLGELSVIYSQIEEITDLLSDLYLDIAMITGESPDRNRDYDLHKQIPDFMDRLTALNETLGDFSNEVEKLAGGKTNSFSAAIKNMARVISAMHKNYYEAQLYLTDYYDNYTSVTSWVNDIKKMSLSIDQIQICPADKNFKVKDVNFFERISFSVKRFFASFIDEYSLNEKDLGDNSVELWVNWGRDQTMVLQNLIKEKFTPDSGIQVNLKITSAGLIKGMLSGNTPDVSLHLARTDPINYAMRGALYDLSQFKDFDDVMKRFGESAGLPYQYKGGTYALPDTQNFNIMYYRSDIFADLGLEVPETWDEFLATTNILQINNMQVWVPYQAIGGMTTVNAGLGGLNLFPTLLIQMGGSIYNEDKTACTFDTPIAYKAFSYWTDMYTKYKIPTSASFYNRFRVGTMPLGIESYTTYTTLNEAAPEIRGRWGIALIPGIRQEDGTIKRSTAGAGTACAILETCENKKAAWEFLKWWTSADTQLSYNNEVEAILGTVSRVTTSNVEAFSNMSWKSDDLEILLSQRDNIQEIPEVPGSYYMTRAVDQAFWNVINSNQSPKDMLIKWGDIANSEIKRKIEEYS